MSSEASHLDLTEHIRSAALAAGACRVGFARVEDVAEADSRLYDRWLAAGHNAGMSYMERNGHLRNHPELLQPGARTIISCAFAYDDPTSPAPIASYALRRDYHEAIREMLIPVVHTIADTTACQSRICVDSAPVRERYWATRSGVGAPCHNGLIWVPGAGMAVLLAEIITQAKFAPDTPIPSPCTHCGICRRACPGGALQPDGTVDARRCHSYLTIEHRGEWPHTVRPPQGVFGCDICRRACPLNKPQSGAYPPVAKPLSLRLDLAKLTPEQIAEMTHAQYCSIFRHTPIRRTPYPRLQSIAHLAHTPQEGH